MRRPQPIVFAVVVLIALGLLAEVISGNRKLLEDVLYRIRSLELPQDPEARGADTNRSADVAAAGRDRWER